jgi:hypothetical protein
MKVNIVTRAVLIVATAAYGSRCIEEFQLYNSCTHCLDVEEGRLMFERKHDCNSVLPSLQKNLYFQTAVAPFTLKEIRKAVADALWLARKELRDDELDR